MLVLAVHDADAARRHQDHRHLGVPLLRRTVQRGPPAAQSNSCAGDAAPSAAPLLGTVCIVCIRIYTYKHLLTHIDSV